MDKPPDYVSGYNRLRNFTDQRIRRQEVMDTGDEDENELCLLINFVCYL